MRELFFRIKEYYRDHEDFNIFAGLLGIFVFSRVLMLLMVPVMNIFAVEDQTIIGYMNPWDAEWYTGIIDNGYTGPDEYGQASWAFFPLYPMIVTVVKTCTFGLLGTYVAGMLVSNICIFLAAFYGVKLLRQMMPERSRHWKLLGVMMFAAPYAFYGASVYTEALFMLCIVLFFYNAWNKRFLAAGVCAALASATRIVGCLLVVPMIMEQYFTYRGSTGFIKGMKGYLLTLFQKPGLLFSIMICPFGTFSYMTFLYFFCHDAWAFFHVQVAWRSEEYFPVIGVLFKACTGQIDNGAIYMGWACIAAMALYGYMLYRKHYSMAVFGIAALLVPLTSHTMSTCRFIVGAFVTYVGLYDLLAGCSQKVRVVTAALMIAVETVMLGMWYFWSPLLM